MQVESSNCSCHCHVKEAFICKCIKNCKHCHPENFSKPMSKKIEEIETRHFPERIVDGVRIAAMDVLTDYDLIDKINELIKEVNQLREEVERMKK